MRWGTACIILCIITSFILLLCQQWSYFKTLETNPDYYMIQLQDGTIVICKNYQQTYGSLNLYDCKDNIEYKAQVNVKILNGGN